MRGSDSRDTHILWTLSDLAVVVLLSVLIVCSVLWMPTLLPAPVQVVLGFVFTFALPGYAITAALYPTMYSRTRSETPEDTPSSPTETAPESDGTGEGSNRPLSPVDGLVLIVGLSIAVVPLAVLLVSFSTADIGPQTTLGAVAVVTASASTVAALRRARVTQSAGFPISQVTGTLDDRFGSEPTLRSTAKVCTVVGLLISAGIAGAALTETRGGERYTELSILTEDEETGNLTADDYPTTLQAGEPAEIIVSVGNNEGEETRYTVVTQLQSVSTTGDERTVTRVNTLDQFSLTVVDDGVSRQRTSVAVNAVAEADRHRLVVLLYRGEPPANPTVSNAYREVHIWTEFGQ